MPATTTTDAGSGLLSANDLRLALRRGGILGGVLVFVALIGALTAFTAEPIMRGVLSLTQALLAFGGLGAGYVAQRSMSPDHRRPPSLAVAGVAGGAAALALLALLALIVNAIDMRAVLVNATPELVTVLTFGLPLGAGVVVLVVLGAVLGAAGALWSLVDARWQRAVLYSVSAVAVIGVLREYGLSWVQGIVIAVVVAAGTLAVARLRPVATRRYRQAQRQRGDLVRWGTYALGALLLLLLPQLLGIYGTSVIDLVGLYVLMGLGLNIVVGYAGLLNLGYVAFFAIGAYTSSLLTSPVSSAHLGMSFWPALIIAAVVTAILAVVLAVPVLRMRGDYLAIVTLGFGEIIRILVLSDTFKGVLGGAQGIIEVPSPSIVSAFTQPSEFYYLILVGCVVAAIVSLRVSESPTGRAWVAMREDEDVAEATGVNLVRHKLLAFALGATFAGVGGAIFASWVHSVFPNSFTLQVSINILSLVIVGGLGSIPGVIIGALVLVGLPEVLRAFADYRMVTFGALLVLMMLARPEGLWPAQHRRRELTEAGEQEEAATWPSA